LKHAHHGVFVRRGHHHAQLRPLARRRREARPRQTLAFRPAQGVGRSRKKIVQDLNQRENGQWRDREREGGDVGERSRGGRCQPKAVDVPPAVGGPA
jgi:hypothetical protein